jgi:hypothetical protein
MKTTFLARVAAKSFGFSEDSEILYHCLVEHQIFTGKSWRGTHSTWDEVQRRFKIDCEAVKERKGYFRKGEAAFLGNRELIMKAGGYSRLGNGVAGAIVLKLTGPAGSGSPVTGLRHWGEASGDPVRSPNRHRFS